VVVKIYKRGEPNKPSNTKARSDKRYRKIALCSPIHLLSLYQTLASSLQVGQLRRSSGAINK